MNSEELELSLRTEFESYLKGFLADLRQEVSEFQKNFESEFEKHKAQTDEGFRKLAERFDTGVSFDQAFNESVVEHLRLARDEGATITAVAIGEAEKLKEASAPAAEFDRLRDAINEISSKSSQSEILKSLVAHASHFAPRGAFFIVKNEQFVGWRSFGDEAGVDEATVRAIQFSMSSDTILTESISALATVSAGSASHGDNAQFLGPLGFGKPDRVYAVPLVARGRGVAVLYADYGTEGVSLNPEALETLVRVAGLTVELAAAGVQPAAAPQHIESPAVEMAPEPAYQAPEPAAEPAAEQAPASAFERFAEETPSVAAEPTPEQFEAAERFEQAEAEAPARGEVETPVETFEEYKAPVETADQYETPAAFVTEHAPAEEIPAAFVEEPSPVEETPSAFEHTPAYEAVSEESVKEFKFETTQPVQEDTYEPVPSAQEDQIQVDRFGEVIVPQNVEEMTYFEPVEKAVIDEQPVAEVTFAESEVVEEYVPAEIVEEFPEVIEEPAVSEPVAEYIPQQQEQPVENGNGATASVVPEPVAEVASAQAARTKYRDRNMDLPIEVPEDERRLHNDARRFARLLVSEIKLYNEQKVTDGRASGDLYDRLREAIDRSREMYDKRVQQPVADKFDYFHYELVNSLAEGNDVKLGASYPGGKVPA